MDDSIFAYPNVEYERLPSEVKQIKTRRILRKLRQRGQRRRKGTQQKIDNFLRVEGRR